MVRFGRLKRNNVGRKHCFLIELNSGSYVQLTGKNLDRCLQQLIDFLRDLKTVLNGDVLGEIPAVQEILKLLKKHDIELAAL